MRAKDIPCPECGELYAAQGLVPHRKARHGVLETKGDREYLDRKNARAKELRAKRNRATARAAKRASKVSTELVRAEPIRRETNHSPKPITVLTNFQVVTDGDKIGLVEWLDR